MRAKYHTAPHPVWEIGKGLCNSRGYDTLIRPSAVGVPVLAGILGLSTLQQNLQSLLSPMFGGTLVAAQLSQARDICTLLAAAITTQQYGRARSISDLCWGMGISLILPMICARRIASFMSTACGKQGALWTIQILLFPPTLIGSVLCERCIVSAS
jgi:predicted membrane protein